ncbi:MAG: ribokinase [Salinivirgaceae bacterium]|jgi:ribokinase|nr:ribokinase [Salinivirgaceae bacterium]
MKKNRVIVIGSYLVALVMDTDRIPLQGETLVARNFHQTHGGKGSNQAVQAARLGAPTSFVGFVGNDSYGHSFVDLCKAEKVDTTNVRFSDKRPTGAGFIVCSNDGHNVITIDIAANLDLTPVAIDALTTDIIPGDIVLIQLEIPVESALYAAKVAKAKGAIVILNPAPAANLSNHDLSFIDFITPNETEARICSGVDQNRAITDEEAAQKLCVLGCKNVIVTQGEKGCLVLNENGFSSVEAFRFQDIVDSTGAGDSFNAAFAVGMLEEKTIAEACRFANAAAGLACTKADTIPSYHYRNEVNEFISKKDLI